MSRAKVLVIGWDGATPHLLRKWALSGHLPFVRTLISQGATGTLKSTIQPLSPQAWCTFMTGKNPGKHGIFDFTERIPGTYQVRFINAKSRIGRSLWRILSERNRKVCIINVPITYPPEPINGYLISGMDTPSTSARFTHPPELADELKRRFGDYLLGRNMWEFILKGQANECVEAFRKMSDQRASIAEWLLESADWDLFVIIFRATDEAQHLFWHYMDQSHPYSSSRDTTLGSIIPDVYKQLDSLTQQLYRLADPEYLLLLSDHGSAPYGTKSLYLNTWLEECGYLKFTGVSPSSAGLSRLFWNLKHFFARSLPTSLKDELKRLFPSLFDKLRTSSAFSHIDWRATSAFSDEVHLNLWVNLEGREPNGIVPPSRYEELREELIKRLLHLKDPDSQTPLFSDVYRREELFWGPATVKAPDILALLSDSGYRPLPRSSVLSAERSFLREVSASEAKLDLKPVAGHTLYGWLGLLGEKVQPAHTLHYAHIADLAPTILYLLHEPIPTDMDGSILRDPIKLSRPPSFEQVREEPLSTQDQTYTPEEAKQVEDRLKGLGYV